jgi:IS605 OrfB family transposase
VCSAAQEGSVNRAKARHRVAVVHRQVRDARLDHAHKVALRLVRDNQAVYAEDLAVSGLMRTRLARSVSDAGWSQLLRCVEEKAARYGRTFSKIGRFEPTSQVCSACGVKDGPKPQRPPVDVRGVRNRTRPGRERGQEHPRPGAQGEAKRLWSRRQTTPRGGWCRSRNPPERGVSRAGGIPVVHGG